MTDDRVDATSEFNQHRTVLISLAYRILGSMADAEDVVQEAWLRWSSVDARDVNVPRAFLIRVTTRVAIDRLRRVKARREAYVGPWLPEPVLTDDVADDLVMAESVSLALMVTLETLSPLERAVFVLREAFAMSHADIAETLGRNEDAIRQLARRARVHVREGSVRYDADQLTRRRVTERFLAAAVDGDLEALLDVLAPGVTLVADGGGRVLAPRRPIQGASNVAQFLLAAATQRQTARFGASVAGEASADVGVRIAHINGGPGVVVTSGGRLITVLVLDVDGGLVHTIHLIANPDKLGGLRGITAP